MGALPLLAATAEALAPASVRRRIAELIPYKPLQHVMSVVDTMANRSAEIIAEKKKEMQDGSNAATAERGKDIMSILRALRLLTCDSEI